jgi:hypothetical protein
MTGHTKTLELVRLLHAWFVYPQFDKILQTQVIFISSNRQDPANSLSGRSARCQIRHYVLLHVAPWDAEVTSWHRNKLNSPSLIQSSQADPVLGI